MVNNADIHIGPLSMPNQIPKNKRFSYSATATNIGETGYAGAEARFFTGDKFIYSNESIFQAGEERRYIVCTGLNSETGYYGMLGKIYDNGAWHQTHMIQKHVEAVDTIISDNTNLPWYETVECGTTVPTGLVSIKIRNIGVPPPPDCYGLVVFETDDFIIDSFDISMIDNGESKIFTTTLPSNQRNLYINVYTNNYCEEYILTTSQHLILQDCETFGNQTDCEINNCYWYYNSCHHNQKISEGFPWWLLVIGGISVGGIYIITK